MLLYTPSFARFEAERALLAQSYRKDAGGKERSLLSGGLCEPEIRGQLCRRYRGHDWERQVTPCDDVDQDVEIQV